MSWRVVCCAWRWKGRAIPFDCTTKRWRDCYPLPPGARRADRDVTELAYAPTQRTRQCTEPTPQRQRHSTPHQSCFPSLKADCRLRYCFVVGQKYSRQSFNANAAAEWGGGWPNGRCATHLSTRGCATEAGPGPRQATDRPLLSAALCCLMSYLFELMANASLGREQALQSREPNVRSATVSGTTGSFVAFRTNKMGTTKMDRRDKELLDKQMRQLTPSRNDGVIAVMLAAMFLVGMTLGSVLSAHQSTPIQIASMD